MWRREGDSNPWQVILAPAAVSEAAALNHSAIPPRGGPSRGPYVGVPGGGTRRLPPGAIIPSLSAKRYIRLVETGMPEAKTPKIDFKALEAVTKKVVKHQPAKKHKATPQSKTDK